MKNRFAYLIMFLCMLAYQSSSAQHMMNASAPNGILLRSKDGFNGKSVWKMIRYADNKEQPAIISTPGYKTGAQWLPAIVPGTVLNSLVYNKVFADPYYGDNNKKIKKIIPDIADVGRAFYRYWFRTEFIVPKSFAGKTVWLKMNGINYRSKIWVNGVQVGTMVGMFNAGQYDITRMAKLGAINAIAVDVEPVDNPGTMLGPRSRPGAFGENRNGGSGDIGKDVTMLMSIGWDFSFKDGIRDRNTGIWRDVEIFATGNSYLSNAFVRTELPLPDTSSSKETISVELTNASDQVQKQIIKGKIVENNIQFEKAVTLAPRETRTILFAPEDFPQLIFRRPKLWWPINKGRQDLYTLQLKVLNQLQSVSHELSIHFGVRTVSTSRNTPDSSKMFVVNGVPVFVRGTNWIPEGMCRFSEKRMEAEMKYTRQAGVNFLRLWGGGIAESDQFYDLCDRYGFLVWTEFWMTGDTKKPEDTALYFKNMTQTVNRIRSHPSMAIYVSSNESTDIPGARELIKGLDPTLDYQKQSETDGVHDGSPYKYENPMQYFENTASSRGSRVDGFNPEYGTPCLPIVECLREMMPEKDLWPINDSVWNYLDGGGFHQVTSKYKEAVNQFGLSHSIDEFAKKAQFVGAMNYRSIWEVWNENKFYFGDRFCSGVLFWYHNSPVRQTGGRMWDWSLEPTAALYYSQNALQPLHAQFDYLKNTVSVYNDYRSAFKGYRLRATVYDLNMKSVFVKERLIDIPQDGLVKDAIKIDFPSSISAVHFIQLELLDEKGKSASESFYWRSSDKYEKAWTMTGPAVSGFQSINQLPEADVQVHLRKETKAGNTVLQIELSNPGKSLSFFTQLKLQDVHGTPIRPAFYSDNFFSLLPGKSKTVTIEVDRAAIPGNQFQLIVDGYNAKKTIIKETL